MPLNETNCRTFHRTLYGAILQTVTLLKRGDDQAEGTVTSFRLYEARHSKLHKTGQAIRGDMSSGDRVTWHLPFSELQKHGITHVNVLDRIVDRKGRVWEPEASTEIRYQLMECHVCVNCKRLN